MASNWAHFLFKVFTPDHKAATNEGQREGPMTSKVALHFMIENACACNTSFTDCRRGWITCSWSRKVILWQETRAGFLMQMRELWHHMKRRLLVRRKKQRQCWPWKVTSMQMREAWHEMWTIWNTIAFTKWNTVKVTENLSVSNCSNSSRLVPLPWE